MNKKIRKVLNIFLIGLFFFSPAKSYADVFRGEITKAGEDKRSFILLYEDQAKSKKEIRIWVTPETKFLGLSTLPEMINGDELIVTAKNNIDISRWEADSVELTKARIRNPEPETPVTEALSDESKIRTAEDKAEKPHLDLAEVEKRFADMEKQIDALPEKALKNSSLREKIDILMADLDKKRMALKTLIEECRTANAEQLPKLTQKALMADEELEEAIRNASSEIAADTIVVV